jgi:YHS domain-containing protein
MGLPATQPAGRRAVLTRGPARSSAAIEDAKASPDPAAIAALRAHLVHVEQVARDSNRLRVDFAAPAATTKDAEVIELLEPVLPWVESLSLARCQVGDSTAAFLASAPWLTELDMSGTQVTNAGVVMLARQRRLSELSLARTHLTDDAVELFTRMPTLQRVCLWRSGLSKDGLAQLRQRRPKLRVEAGDSPVAATRAAETEVKFSSEAPLPGVAQTQPAVAQAKPQTQPAPAVALARPINTVCPVSGKPVDPRYTIIYHGQVIGFCCPHCPTTFWENPAQFEGKLAALAPTAKSN